MSPKRKIFDVMKNAHNKNTVDSNNSSQRERFISVYTVQAACNREVYQKM